MKSDITRAISERLKPTISNVLVLSAMLIIWKSNIWRKYFSNIYWDAVLKATGGLLFVLKHFYHLNIPHLFSSRRRFHRIRNELNDALSLRDKQNPSVNFNVIRISNKVMSFSTRSLLLLCSSHNSSKFPSLQRIFIELQNILIQNLTSRGKKALQWKESLIAESHIWLEF